MNNDGANFRATLDAWREQHADRLDPIRFHFMAALERRAASHDGEARRVLDRRLSCLLEAYAADLERAASNRGHAGSPATSGAVERGALGKLIDHIDSCAPVQGDEVAAGEQASRSSMFPTMEALDHFRDLWSRIRAESQLRQSLEQVPTHAGPLNSGALVHRSIALMRELSPGYLQQFLLYVDALSWMEQMNPGGVLASNAAQPTASAKKRVRDKPQKPRGRRE